MWQIRYIRHREIDFLKWDECLNYSADGLLYAYSRFLNHMSPGWDALVMNDYEAIMPLTHRKKWGIRYLYQPAFCAELGVFSRTGITSSLVKAFLNEIPAHFRFIDICLNRSNHIAVPEIPFRIRNNYLLSLQSSYESIAGNFSLNHRRNIRKALNQGLRLSEHLPVNDAVKIARHTLRNIGDLPEEDWKRFVSLYLQYPSRDSVICVGVKNREEELLSVAVFMFAHGRWHYLLAGSTPKGRKTGAAHFLIDQFIRQYAGTDVCLDFEGSDVDSVALFYSGFGAVKIQYPAFRLNRLPGLIRWMK